MVEGGGVSGILLETVSGRGVSAPGLGIKKQKEDVNRQAR